MLTMKNEPFLKDGEPCNHPGCLSHVSHPCERCGRIGGYKKTTPPETIYLQCYDEYTGALLDFISDDVTWCRDQINDNDAVYILATSELTGLLERLGGYTECLAHEYPELFESAEQDEQTVFALAIRIKDSLG